MKHNDIKENWSIFARNYLNIASLACSEMQYKKYNNVESEIEDLYISMIFNIKHGIELYLKFFIVLLEQKALIKKYETHDNLQILRDVMNLTNLSSIKKVINTTYEKNKDNEYWVFVNKSHDNIIDKIYDLMMIVNKYQNLETFKNIINKNFEIEDSDNTSFKYPQNSLKIKLNYKEILKNINKRDLIDIYLDIVKLQNSFYTLEVIFSAYKENESIIKK
jgi:hypothetical protein